jgi:hypothetical protein
MRLPPSFETAASASQTRVNALMAASY